MARGSGRTYTNTRQVGGAWGALRYVLTVLHLHTCDWETPYRSPYPTPLLSPNPPGARCLPVHCVSHPFASAVLRTLPSLRILLGDPQVHFLVCVHAIARVSVQYYTWAVSLQCPILCA